MSEAPTPQAPRWPDFYALLEITPEADPSTLRRQLNLLYDRANQNSDHRELKKRFYFQLLNQKVLPQCRRILLDEATRRAYDTQWQLHFLGADDALSYERFIARLRQTHERVVSGLSEISADELEMLPFVAVAEDSMPAEIPTQIMPEGTQNAAASEVRAAVTPVIIRSGDSSADAPKSAQDVAAPTIQGAPSGIPGGVSSGASKKSLLPLAVLGALAILALGGWMVLGHGGGGGQSSGDVGAVDAATSAQWKPVSGYIMTEWAAKVKPTAVLPEYPRPQMERKEWLNLNGLWNYALSDKGAAAPTTNDGQILVPFPYESALSGVGKKSIPDRKLWVRRDFKVPQGWNGQRVILHFGAVNYQSAVKVNGKPVGSHQGGFDSFEFDVTDALQNGDNAIEVSITNPIDVEGGQIIGKQRAKSEGIWYTASTGIWQTVWLEPVPATSIKDLVITPDIDDNTLSVSTALASLPGETAGDVTVQVEALDGKRSLAKKSGAAGKAISLSIPSPKLWTPDAPKLYDLRVSILRNGKEVDGVNSYFAMRKTSVARDEKGVPRLMLNNKFVMQYGVLDQGYWPEGLYTAPTDEALAHDIVMAKKLGFNMCRKHTKVEPARWYYHADRLGYLVWQDMPAMFNSSPSPEVAAQFKTEWKRIIEQHRNSPSIIVWTPFNESWGQHATSSVVDFTRSVDATRPVNEASGWNDTGSGDINDNHSYPTPKTKAPDGKRATVNGEFGGIGLALPNHVWNADVNFNYGNARNGWTLTRDYQKMMRNANALRDKSQASAFVYTQITDVEQETNGLMSYDRKVLKPILNVTAAATRGKFIPLPPNPFAPIITTSQGTAHVWAYSLEKPAEKWAQPGFDSSSWKRGAAGFGGGEIGVSESKIRTPWTSSDIWIRREIEMPSAFPDDLNFLCAHDEDVEIYINGVLAAEATKFTTSYVDLPMTPAGRAAIRPGKNIIAAHCKQTAGGQYLDIGIAPGA